MVGGTVPNAVPPVGDVLRALNEEGRVDPKQRSQGRDVSHEGTASDRSTDDVAPEWEPLTDGPAEGVAAGTGQGAAARGTDDVDDDETTSTSSDPRPR
jgi:hypothetical protein